MLAKDRRRSRRHHGDHRRSFTSAPAGKYLDARYEVASGVDYGYSYFTDRAQAEKKADEVGGIVIDLEAAGEDAQARVAITLNYGYGSLSTELQLVPGWHSVRLRAPVTPSLAGLTQAATR